MRRLTCAGAFLVLSGLTVGHETAVASPDGSKVGPGAGWLVQEPTVAKTPIWVPGSGRKLHSYGERNPGPYSWNRSGSRERATPNQTPGARSIAGKSRAVSRGAAKFAPAPYSSPQPQPLPKPRRSGLLNQKPRPTATPMPLPMPRPFGAGKLRSHSRTFDSRPRSR